MTRPAQTIVVAGFSWDIASVVAQLGDLGRSIVAYDQETSAEYDAAISRCDVVVYVFGLGTDWSSQLLGHFSYLHVARRPAREFILRVPPASPRSFIFSVIAAVPQIDIDELRRLIAGA